MNRLLEIVEQKETPKNIVPFKVGDTIRVHTRILERQKERIQIAEGMVIASRGRGRGKTFTIRKVSYGVGVERIFNFYSPVIEKVSLVRRGTVRRAKLYYLRHKKGSQALKKITEKKI